ncbi:putative Exosome complex exonuclease RRP44 [Blattamonas nauphoetae]|uniref:Exosome complex exonuclease RRP44 n=1 Tax=Blattamonas nauphoetae TaxID=2049346 RepID=A0ABQ9XZ24_9EUKA|nr:putative Exosome complex exonuclease RRP44 [Blattamonas nauphoetae]
MSERRQRGRGRGSQSSRPHNDFAPIDQYRQHQRAPIIDAPPGLDVQRIHHQSAPPSQPSGRSPFTPFTYQPKQQNRPPPEIKLNYHPDPQPVPKQTLIPFSRDTRQKQQTQAPPQPKQISLSLRDIDDLTIQPKPVVSGPTAQSCEQAWSSKQEIVFPTLNDIELYSRCGICLVGHIQLHFPGRAAALNTPYGRIPVSTNVSGYLNGVMHNDLVAFTLTSRDKQPSPKQPKTQGLPPSYVQFQPNKIISGIHSRKNVKGFPESIPISILGPIDMSTRPSQAIYIIQNEQSNSFLSALKCVNPLYPNVYILTKLLEERLQEEQRKDEGRALLTSKSGSKAFYCIINLQKVVLYHGLLQKGLPQISKQKSPSTILSSSFIAPPALSNHHFFASDFQVRFVEDKQEVHWMEKIPLSIEHFGPYSPHLSREDIQKGLADGTIFATFLKMQDQNKNAKNMHNDPNKRIDNIYAFSPKVPVDFRIMSTIALNRATPGTVLFTKLHPRFAWHHQTLSEGTKKKLARIKIQKTPTDGLRDLTSLPPGQEEMILNEALEASIVPFEGNPHLFHQVTSESHPFSFPPFPQIETNDASAELLNEIDNVNIHPIECGPLDLSSSLCAFSTEEEDVELMNDDVLSLNPHQPIPLSSTDVVQPTGFVVGTGVRLLKNMEDLSQLRQDTPEHPLNPELTFSGRVEELIAPESVDQDDPRKPPTYFYSKVLVRPLVRKESTPSVIISRADLFESVVREFLKGLHQNHAEGLLVEQTKESIRKSNEALGIETPADLKISNRDLINYLRPSEKDQLSVMRQVSLDTLIKKNTLFHSLKNLKDPSQVSEEKIAQLMNSIREQAHLLPLPRPIFISVTANEWRPNSNVPSGAVQSIIGIDDSLNTLIRILLENGSIDTSPFKKELIDELPREDWYASIENGDFDGRRRFFSTRVYTIDPATACDLDDAVSVDILHDRTRLPERLREAEEDFYEIAVHIADVTHFVKNGSAADLVAQKRCTSHYLLDRVIPMLPKILSNCLCSLNPGVDRLAVSVSFVVSADGIPVEDGCLWFGRSVIRSCLRMDYEQAQRLFINGEKHVVKNLTEAEAARFHQGDSSVIKNGVILPYYPHEHAVSPVNGHEAFELGEPVFPTEEEIRADLRLLWKFADFRKKDRIAQGSVAFSRTEIRFIVDEETFEPSGVTFSDSQADDVEEPSNDPSNLVDIESDAIEGNGSGIESHQLIEELMLTANCCVAIFINDTFPNHACIRTHPVPDPIVLNDMQKTIKFYNLPISLQLDEEGGQNPNTAIARAIECASSLSEEVSLGFLSLLRSNIKQAVYTLTGGDGTVLSIPGSTSKLIEYDENNWTWRHFALAFPLYTHFTSPIRRYPDQVVHRLLLSALHLRSNGVKEWKGNVITSEMVASDCISPHVPKSILPLSYVLDLPSILSQCNERRKADLQLKYRSAEVFLSRFIEKHCKRKAIICVAIVTWIDARSITFEIPGLDVHMKVAYRELGRNYYYDDETMSVYLGVGTRLKEKPQLKVLKIEKDLTISSDLESGVSNTSIGEDPDTHCSALMNSLSSQYFVAPPADQVTPTPAPIVVHLQPSAPPPASYQLPLPDGTVLLNPSVDRAASKSPPPKRHISAPPTSSAVPLVLHTKPLDPTTAPWPAHCNLKLHVDCDVREVHMFERVKVVLTPTKLEQTENGFEMPKYNLSLYQFLEECDPDKIVFETIPQELWQAMISNRVTKKTAQTE